MDYRRRESLRCSAHGRNGDTAALGRLIPLIHGKKPVGARDVSRPGTKVPCAERKLMKLSGSSMAAGVASGLVEVRVETHDWIAYQRWQNTSRKRKGKKAAYEPPPALTPNAVKAMLQYSATPLPDADGVR
jgi:hypothetical protein